MNPFKFLDGWKSYIGAAGFGLAAAYEFLNGNTNQAYEYALLAWTIFGLRQAVSKVAR